MAVRGFQVTASTMGQSSPASVAEGNWYRYGGTKFEDTSPELTAGGAERTRRREERITEFAAALADLGEPDPWRAPRAVAIEAGKRINVGPKTARGYLTALRQRHPEGKP